jgi:DNA-binding transcriptional ArsR family regulator
MQGIVDVSVPAALLADAGRSRILFALADGRALPASVLAREAEVAASTASEHLSRLVAAGMLEVERQGRHRYYRIARPEVVQALEALTPLAPVRPVRSLRQGTRAHQMRMARMCYDHLAGRLGVALMGRLVEGGLLDGGDGLHHPETARQDRLSAPGHDVDYHLTDAGAAAMRDLGVDLDRLGAGRRPLVRYCLDWTEQRHHLAGSLGAAVAGCLFDRAWIHRVPNSRAVRLTEAGRTGLAESLGVRFDGLDPVPTAGANFPFEEFTS